VQCAERKRGERERCGAKAKFGWRGSHHGVAETSPAKLNAA
jgi:hypothetical protein